ncbi:13675_t:CDS:1, partial [Cetraspora pellucida]
HLSNNATDTITQANHYLLKAATLAEIKITPVTQEEFTLSQLNTTN